MARTDAKTIQTDDLDGSRSVGRVGLEHSIADERRLGFNDLLAKAEIDPRDVVILRHRPTEPALNKILPALAAEQPDLFNAYQQTQSPALERAMLGVRYLASFIGREPGKALFVGLYVIGPSTAVTKPQCWKKPAYRRLLDLGMRGFEPDVRRKTLLWFDLASTDFCADWKGKLVIGWPPPERSWWRRAHKGSFPILAIHDESALVGAMPDWQDLALTWAELAAIPQSWRAAMSQWRGIYHIIDTSDGKAYVGSASGMANILGRWLGYASTGHGGNQLLRARDPRHFRFSILQLVSPSTAVDDVVRLENTWKARLNTWQPQGLNLN